MITRERLRKRTFSELFGPVLFLLTTTNSATTMNSSYCRFTPEHTLCQHLGVGVNCGPQVPARGVTQDQMALIVREHNVYRSRIAMGQEHRGKSGPQPPAANMMAMHWDPELAEVAQMHADQCVFKHDCMECRQVERFNVGQNLFISFSSVFDSRMNWKRAVESWYEEVDKFNPSQIEPYRFVKETGHYSQLSWWNSRAVGCGVTMFQEDGWWKKLYTCNYGPAGNIISAEMYKEGDACSLCPAGTSCSVQFPGLCEMMEQPKLQDSFHTDNEIGGPFQPRNMFKPFEPPNEFFDNHHPTEDGHDNTKVQVINFSGNMSALPNNIQDFLKTFSGGMIPQTLRISSTMLNPGMPESKKTVTTFQIDGLSPDFVFGDTQSSTPEQEVRTLDEILKPPSQIMPVMDDFGIMDDSMMKPPSQIMPIMDGLGFMDDSMTNMKVPPVGQENSFIVPELTESSLFTPSLTTLSSNFGGVPLEKTAFGEPRVLEPVFGSNDPDSDGSPKDFAGTQRMGEIETDLVIPDVVSQFAGLMPRANIEIEQAADVSQLEETIEALKQGRIKPNSQVVKTNNVLDVQRILESIPDGIEPIILYRSENGVLLQLDPTTLEPLQRDSDPTSNAPRIKRTASSGGEYYVIF